MDIQRLKGFRDILPDETPVWQLVERIARGAFERYGYEEIRLPLVEETALFTRSIGEDTDIVEKEMYTFSDTGGTSVALRPEGTASAVRAYLENGLHRTDPKSRLYYLGPMFRRERPQKGRHRQFHQLGAECFGWAEPSADADLLCLLSDFFSDLGLSERVNLELNSLGCLEDRARYREHIRARLSARKEDLCENCRRRIDTNPLRVLDCKSARCRQITEGLPPLPESLCPECSEHFRQVLDLLDAQGLGYSLNPRMVRGLDYYNRTTFELVSGGLGAQNAVAAGGRYDGLVEMLGGPAVPALGFAVGVERLVLLLGDDAASRPAPLAYVIHGSESSLREALLIRRELLRTGVIADIDYEPRSLKAQLRAADRRGARFALILGEDEIASRTVTIKDMANGTQETVSRSEAVFRVVAQSSPPEKEG